MEILHISYRQGDLNVINKKTSSAKKNLKSLASFFNRWSSAEKRYAKDLSSLPKLDLFEEESTLRAALNSLGSILLQSQHLHMSLGSDLESMAASQLTILIQQMRSHKKYTLEKLEGINKEYRQILSHFSKDHQKLEEIKGNVQKLQKKAWFSGDESNLKKANLKQSLFEQSKEQFNQTRQVFADAENRYHSAVNNVIRDIEKNEYKRIKDLQSIFQHTIGNLYANCQKHTVSCQFSAETISNIKPKLDAREFFVRNCIQRKNIVKEKSSSSLQDKFQNVKSYVQSLLIDNKPDFHIFVKLIRDIMIEINQPSIIDEWGNTLKNIFLESIEHISKWMERSANISDLAVPEIPHFIESIEDPKQLNLALAKTKQFKGLKGEKMYLLEVYCSWLKSIDYLKEESRLICSEVLPGLYDEIENRLNECKVVIVENIAIRAVWGDLYSDLFPSLYMKYNISTKKKAIDNLFCFLRNTCPEESYEKVLDIFIVEFVRAWERVVLFNSVVSSNMFKSDLEFVSTIFYQHGINQESMNRLLKKISCAMEFSLMTDNELKDHFKTSVVGRETIAWLLFSRNKKSLNIFLNENKHLI